MSPVRRIGSIAFGGYGSNAFTMLTGTMGTPVLMAIEKTPPLNLCNLPSRERVPSGKAKTDTPWLSQAIESLTARSCPLRDERSISTCLPP